MSGPDLQEDVQGIGDATEERLKEFGIETVEELAQANPNEIGESDVSISASKAKKLIARASESRIAVQTGDDVKEEYEGRDRFTSGMEDFDDMLGGGFREEDIVGIVGASDSGKTQLTFYSLVNAVEATGLPAVYIETERNRYSPKRLDSLASEDGTQSKIYRIPAYDLDDQLNAYGKVKKLPEKMGLDGISLVAIDSFNARLRLASKYDGRGSLSQRSTEIGEHLRGIEDMVDTLGCPCLMTMQVYGNPSGFGSGTKMYGGELLNHMLAYQIKMSDAEGAMKQAQLAGSSSQDSQELHIRISDRQLEAMDDL